MYFQAAAPAQENLIFRDPAWNAILADIRRIARCNVRIVLLGETGVGKFEVAQRIHLESGRSNLVRLFCPAIADTLFESEMFGHERNAFTGAVAKKLGLIEVSHGGTLVLEEVDCLTPPQQQKLLGVLEYGMAVRRVGGTASAPVDVRVIATSNRDLWKMVDKGEFRPDLLYRLSEIEIRVPPLRDRQGDILPMIEYFLRQSPLNPEGRIVLCADPDDESMVSVLKKYPWPGNSREVRNVVGRALVNIPENAENISIQDIVRALPVKSVRTAVEISPTQNFGGARTLEDIRVFWVKRALEENQWTVYKAAAQLGIAPGTLYHFIKSYNLRCDST